MGSAAVGRSCGASADKKQKTHKYHFGRTKLNKTTSTDTLTTLKTTPTARITSKILTTPKQLQSSQQQQP